MSSKWIESKPGVGWNVLTIVFAIAAAPWWAWVAVKNYTWFVVPLGVPPIGMAQMFGIAAFIGMFRSSTMNKNDGYSERERDIHRLCTAWLGPLIALCFGHIANWFMH